MKKIFTRRKLLEYSLSIPFVKLTRIGNTCEPTLIQPLGPFYKVPNEANNFDITNGGQAKGEIIIITGKILNKDCLPYSHALIDIWQANYFGKYSHINDKSKSQTDKNFNGYIRIKTNKKGEYKIKTIIPGSYRITKNIIRTPHLHFRVTTVDKQFTTQMYFKGHKYNKNDFLYKRIKNVDSVSVAFVENKNSKIKSGKFDIII